MMRRLLAACIIAAFASSCGKDSYEHVVYDADVEPPALTPDDTTVHVPEWSQDRAAAGELFAPVQVRQVKIGSQVVVEGSCSVEAVDAKESLPMVNVKMRRIEPGRKPVIHAMGAATTTREGRKLKYNVQFKAPTAAGHFDIEVRLRPKSDAPEIRLVVAEADVE